MIMATSVLLLFDHKVEEPLGISLGLRPFKRTATPDSFKKHCFEDAEVSH